MPVQGIMLCGLVVPIASLVLKCVYASTGPMRGVFFEKLAHVKLQDGGTFECRDLKTGKVSKRKIKKSGMLLFDQLSEVTSADNGVYARPNASNLSAVDALIQVGLVMGKCSALSHDLRMT